MRKFSLIAAAVAMTAGSLTADIQIGKGLTVGGFIDMAYTNVDSSYTSAPGVAAVSGDTAGFDASVAEFQFGMDFGNGLTATVDLEGSPMTDGASTIDVEQARIDYSFGQSTLTLGKFNTFIGLESIEAPEMYQFSSSLSTDQAPTQHEGICYGYNGGMWNLAAALVNGYASDDTNAAGDSKKLAYALHLGLAPSDALSFNVNYALDNNDDSTQVAGSADDTTVWTIDASYSNHGWTVGAEYISLDNENGTAVETETDAWMLMANYMFTEQFGLTARYSESETKNGSYKFGAQPAVNGTVERDEITVAASYAFTPNWSGVLEYRMDDVQVTAVGTNANTDVDTIAIESILTF